MKHDLENNNIYYLLLSYLLIIGVAFYAAFDSLAVMEQMWGAKEEYGYAYIIPFVSGYLIWQRLDKLSEVKFESSLMGGVIFLGAMIIMLLGVLSATHSITQYGFIFTLIAAVYMLMGSAVLRIVIAPMLLLLTAVPLPVFIFNSLSGYLQLISSEIGVGVIRLFGISVFLEGNVIDLGTYKLQVVEACSGLRYLFPLFSLSIIAAFLFKAAFWKRCVLVLSSLPITVLMNSFRIGVIGVLVEYWGIEQAEGFLHDFEGWIIFMACMAFLIIEMWLLLKIGSDNRKLSEAFSLEVPENSDLKFRPVNLSVKFVVMTVAAIGIGIAISLVNERQEVIPDREEFSTFPLVFDGWKGERGEIEDVVLGALQLDDYIIADYANSDGEMVNFYAAYYKSQRSGQAAHSPRSCIPGGGWKIDSFSTESVDVSPVSEEIKVNRLLIVKGEHAQLVYYWFQQRGRIITNEYLVKLYLFWDSLTMHRSDGSLMRFTTMIKPGEDIASADNRLEKFIRLTYSHYPEFIPE